MKRLMSHGHAIRSTRARSRVIHFMTCLLWILDGPWPSTVRCGHSSVVEIDVRPAPEHARALVHGDRRRDVLQRGPAAVEHGDLVGARPPGAKPGDHVAEL